MADVAQLRDRVKGEFEHGTSLPVGRAEMVRLIQILFVHRLHLVQTRSIGVETQELRLQQLQKDGEMFVGRQLVDIGQHVKVGTKEHRALKGFAARWRGKVQIEARALGSLDVGVVGDCHL